MTRDRLAAQLAAVLKWLLPACLSVSRVGRRGKGVHSLSNLKPRVNPSLFLPLRSRAGLLHRFPSSSSAVRWPRHFCTYLSFQGQTRGKARPRASQLKNVCGLCPGERRGGGERRQKKQRDHTREVAGLWGKKKNLPLPSGFSGLLSPPPLFEMVTHSPPSYLRPEAISPLFSRGKKRGNVLFKRKGVTRKKERKRKKKKAIVFIPNL